MGQSPDTRNDVAVWEELWVGWGRQPGWPSREESHTAAGQKDNLPMFAVQKELLSGLPGHRAFQSHLPPHTMITIRKASASAHLRVERDTEVSECLFYAGQICTHTHRPEWSRRTSDVTACLPKGEQCLFWCLAWAKGKSSSLQASHSSI